MLFEELVMKGNECEVIMKKIKLYMNLNNWL